MVVDPNKFEVVVDWSRPMKISEVGWFLYLLGYYHRFVKNFSQLVIPMSKLLKDIKVRWIDRCEESFRKVEGRITLVSTLTSFKVVETFIVFIDASREGYRRVLMFSWEE